MAEVYTVSLDRLISAAGLDVVYTPTDPKEILISNNDINRPGLQLTGFYAYFNTEKIQIMGNTEFAYLNGLSPSDRQKSLSELFSHKVPAVIIARGHEPFPELLNAAREYETPL